jgi:hypothetical protein
LGVCRGDWLDKHGEQNNAAKGIGVKQFLLILGTLILIAIALVVFARRGQVASPNFRTEVIRADDGVLYVIEYFDQQIVVLLPKVCTEITSRTATNSQTRSLDADVDLYSSEGRPRVNIQFHSSNPSALLINDQSFDLYRGGVFLVKEDEESSNSMKIVQAPFRPLEASRAYLTKIREELDK